jgi:hypothetical protein
MKWIIMVTMGIGLLVLTGCEDDHDGFRRPAEGGILPPDEQPSAEDHVTVTPLSIQIDTAELVFQSDEAVSDGAGGSRTDWALNLAIEQIRLGTSATETLTDARGNQTDLTVSVQGDLP